MNEIIGITRFPKFIFTNIIIIINKHSKLKILIFLLHTYTASIIPICPFADKNMVIETLVYSFSSITTPEKNKGISEAISITYDKNNVPYCTTLFETSLHNFIEQICE